MINLQRDFYMAEGEGEHSYAKNSRIQVTLLYIPFNLIYHACTNITTQYAFVRTTITLISVCKTI
jgi:hypothetical protein